jgi:hypothetical protein
MANFLLHLNRYPILLLYHKMDKDISLLLSKNYHYNLGIMVKGGI